MKNHYTLLILSVCFLITFLLNAQNDINGFLLDAKGKPIYFGTVALMNSDSLIIQGESTEEDGSFNITDIKAGKYILEGTLSRRLPN